jgi:hypothetical protein
MLPSQVAARWQFRLREPDESEAAYRRALAYHIRDVHRDPAAAGEILLDKPRSAWTMADKGALFDHLVLG